MPRLERLAVALDTADWGRFRAWTELFGPRVGYLKVGLEAYVRFGPRAVEQARSSGARVFLDLKLHDIPNTVAGATAAARELGASLLTLHAGGGAAMLAAAAEAAQGEIRLLAVTVLTHLDPPALAELDLPGAIPARALAWARLARAAGSAGVVCSAQELAALRPELPRPFLLVTPGIRPPEGEAGDQKRVATPEAALAAGSDLLVVGRPLTAAADPEAALAAFAAAGPA